MKGNLPLFKNSKFKIIFLILSTCVAVFFVLMQTVDFYSSDFSGALFELLWLPEIVLIFILPVISIVFWFKEKFSLKSIYLYTFIALTVSLIYIIFFR